MEFDRNKDFVDIERELKHWALAFGEGKLPAISFRHEVDPVIRLACDIYVRNPRGTREAWLDDLRTRLATKASLRGNLGSAEIAEGCWNLLSPVLAIR